VRALVCLALLAAAAAAGPAALPEGARSFAERRERLSSFLRADYALVIGQPLTDALQPGQEGHFLYLTGVDDPDASLLLAGPRAAALALETRAGVRRTREVLFLRYDSPRFRQFYGLRWSPGPGAASALGVQATRASPRGGEGLGRRLAELLPEDARLHLPRYRSPDQGLVREIRADVARVLHERRPDVAVVDLHPQLARMRSVKDEREVAALRSAVDVTVAAFRDALPEIRPGSSEAAVDGALIAGVRKRGGRPAYTFVVAAGENGAIPHYFRNEGPLRAGDLLVIDAGAAMDRYAADVTRTFPVSGRFTPRQRAAYVAVLEAQRAGIAAVRPGATFSDVHRAAKRVLADAGLGRYFIHQTSHHVGLDVHDPGPRKLVPGMTLTVEPGVYLADEGFGIRIEDVVLVREKGAEVLSAGFPKDPDAIERLLAASRK